MKKAIVIENLTKTYGDLKAVDNISFYVEEGSLFAFLGPNGAGKSTTISILNTFLKPDGGRVEIGGRILGKEDSKIRAEIGAVFQESLLDPLLTVKENLSIRGSFYGLKGKSLKNAVADAIEKSGATDFMNRPYGKLSGGQRRRADIARALVNTPKILFLDEPTTGLDPQTRKSVWETIRKLQEGTKMTVLLTTRSIEEAAQAGILAGFPVLGIHANCYDGSYHEVDSSEMAFHIAGSLAFKDAMKQGSPVLLEPIMKVEVTMPEEYMGDIIGDLNSRRGRIEGMDDLGGGKIVRAYVPLSEMFGYSTDLRSRTQGRGNYSMFFEKYEQVPKSVQEKILSKKD